MLDLELINQAIEELENGKTTLYSCSRLADLYTVRHYTSGAPIKSEQHETKHADEDMPALADYKLKKAQYGKGEATEDCVIEAMAAVSSELKQLVHTLFEMADLPEEKDIMVQTVATLKTLY